jgi:TatD DNase family protein
MFIDIAANLTDDMFQGIYHGKQRHSPDLGAVIERAKAASVDQLIVLAGTLEEAYKCLDICNRFDTGEMKSLFTTVGFHPTRCGEALDLVGHTASDQQAEDVITEKFTQFIEKAHGRVVAFGEFGLDFDRLHFCSKDIQKRFFEIQLRVATKRFPDLPLLLHLRNAFDDFIEIISKYKVNGVVHSFTGSKEEMERLVAIGLHIGVNGCSLRESLDVIPHIPAERILLETDSPYCDIRPTHPGFVHLQEFTLPTSVKPEKFVLGSLVKGRNEPCCIDQVAFVVSGVRKVDHFGLAQTIRSNTSRLFRLLK